MPDHYETLCQRIRGSPRHLDFHIGSGENAFKLAFYNGHQVVIGYDPDPKRVAAAQCCFGYTKGLLYTSSLEEVARFEPYTSATSDRGLQTAEDIARALSMIKVCLAPGADMVLRGYRLKGYSRFDIRDFMTEPWERWILEREGLDAICRSLGRLDYQEAFRAAERAAGFRLVEACFDRKTFTFLLKRTDR